MSPFLIIQILVLSLLKIERSRSFYYHQGLMIKKKNVKEKRPNITSLKELKKVLQEFCLVYFNCK